MAKIPNHLSTGDPQKKKKAIKEWVLKKIPWNEKWTELNGEFPNSEDSEID